jgi:hypothetical protein
LFLTLKENRADHSGVGGPASVTNGGTAMLVMRNFGYLGLHTAVNKNSVLARDRLVDFTGAFQLRRQEEERPPKNENEMEAGSYERILPSWRPDYISEPTRNGGRPMKQGLVSDDDVDSPSRLYAQELALWPILLSPSVRTPRSSQSGISSVRNQQETEDIEPLFHTSFCNELLCHPRILHNGPKSRLVVKIELREVEWNEAINTYCAHEVSDKFSETGIHNHRRGPPLVKHAFTSCTPERSLHQFIEDFKIRLPLQLDSSGERRKLSIFFTVYRLRIGAKGIWKSIFNSSATDENEAEEMVRNGCLVRLACGYLPLEASSGLLEDGVHEVLIGFKAIAPSLEMCKRYELPESSFVLKEMAFTEELASTREESVFIENGDRDTDASVTTDTTDGRSVNDDSYSMLSKTRREPLTLMVGLRNSYWQI